MTLSCTAVRPCLLRELLRREMGLSSTLVKRLKTTGAICVNGLPAPVNARLAPGDRVAVCLDEPPPGFPPEDGPLDILYEDDALLALDKPPGLPVHPTAARRTGTLANRAAGYYRATGQRCGVHTVTRLDRDTFGVVLLAKNAHVHALLSEALRAGLLKKTYLAAVLGAPPRNVGVIDLPIARCPGPSLRRMISPAGDAARTRCRVLARGPEASLLLLRPETGRTHQLRVHCAALGCPILGDRDYGTEASLALSRVLGAETQQLCAARLRLPHPITGAALAITSRQRPLLGK
ncbi:MAG: RluA family pseudouridine synthase [Oscillospiraceae bacterium]|nr:RluA family pseudouridine synthase [Oscillospiraceae bacterium]